MAEKKMTQKRALEIAAMLISMEVERIDADELDPEIAEAEEVIVKMIEKKSAPKPRKVDELTIAFRDAIVRVLENADGPLTNKEIQEELQERVDAGELKLAPGSDGKPTEKVSPQRVANNIKVLEKSGVITRVRGEKASDKDSFILD